MNKRILVIAMVLVMMLTLMIPVQLQAKSGNSPQPQSRPQQFTADGQIGIIDAGILSPARQFGPLMFQHQENEVVNGYIENSNWSDLNGAEIWIVHNADSIFSFKTGTFAATAKGSIEIDLKDGTGRVLTGSYQAIIYGKFVVGADGYIYYSEVNDIAKWDLGSLAQGNAFATLSLGLFESPTYGPIETYTGALSMSGTHK